jgi:hypothetical protein
MRFSPAALLLAALLFSVAPVIAQPASAPAQQSKPLREPDVIYVPTPQPVVDAML